jgi:hypothetical protein
VRHRPVLLAALLSTGGLLVTTAPPATAGDVPSTRLFLHSASGSYANDALGTAPFTAPAGSTWSAAPPTRTTSATALHRWASVPGSPVTPTFRVPFTGTIRNVCIDFYVQSQTFTYQPPPPRTGTPIWINIRFYPGTPGVEFKELNSFGFTTVGPGILRITGHITAPGGALDVTEGQPVVIIGAGVNNPDWTLYYDSVTHPSSLIPNLKPTRCSPARFPAPKPPA